MRRRRPHSNYNNNHHHHNNTDSQELENQESETSPDQPIIHLKDLKSKSPESLQEQAEELVIENVGSMLKQEMIFAILKKLVEQGGLDQWYYADASTQVVDVKLGEPALVYTRYYIWEQETNTNKELYIPALRFPVLEAPKTEYYYNKDSVVIPLAQEILKQRSVDNGVRPMPVEPMPMVK